MRERRIDEHPILEPIESEAIPFTWDGAPLGAKRGETIAAALFAHGIRVFGHHPQDGSPQGIFCANGQCSQCLVLADGRPVKACVTAVSPGMRVEPANGLPELPQRASPPRFGDVPEVAIPVLIVGGGPSGLAAATELARHGIRSLVVDDKSALGGKLVLQTHRFFGSRDAVFAGTRGIEIARRLEREAVDATDVELWREATALAVYSDRSVGILRARGGYVSVRPEALLVAAGAREKTLLFPGHTLPGVYGAGAFQTLVNRDLVRPAQRLLIIGGGNVGLIAGYHALQAGIDVVGLIELLPQCGGYRVHRDKLARLGVPIHTSHTVLSAQGEGEVQSITVARVDSAMAPIPGTERTFACDTILVAVGLDPVRELYLRARSFGFLAVAAGDADEIAEASAAIFSGRIRAVEIARALGRDIPPVPEEWTRTLEILKSPGGATVRREAPQPTNGPFPVFHCTQEIPCDPCSKVCPQSLIAIDPSDIRATPRFLGAEEERKCVACERCVLACPGLAVTLVDPRRDPASPTVTIPFEFGADRLGCGTEVTALDAHDEPLGTFPVVDLAPRAEGTSLLRLQAPTEIAARISGVRLQAAGVGAPLPEAVAPIDDELVVCRCERVTAREIRALIEAGCRDVNEIKAVTRAGMGACGGKTCASLVRRLFYEAGVDPEDVTENVRRPLFVEAPLAAFAAGEEPSNA